MELITSWKDSVQLLRPQNLKQFLLITIKAVLDFYKSLNTFFSHKSNWIIFLSTIFLVGLAHIIVVWQLFSFGGFLINGTRWCAIFFLCLALRDSVGIKDRNYFVSYLIDYWYVFVGALFLAIGFEAIPFVLLWYIFFMLFSFDTNRSLGTIAHNVKQSSLMLIYNLPACTFLYVVLSVLGIILYRLEAWALGYAVGFVFIIFLYGLFLPLQVALITNFYLKRLHEQPDLYFDVPKQ